MPVRYSRSPIFDLSERPFQVGPREDGVAGAPPPGQTASGRDHGLYPPGLTFSELPGAAGGTGGTSVAVGATGDPWLDGLLGGRRWSGGAITYTDPDAADDYQSGYVFDNNSNGTSAQNEGFSRISASQFYAVQYGLDALGLSQTPGSRGFSVEGFTDLSISYGDPASGAGNIRVANSGDNSFGWAFFPSSSIYGGDVWLGTAIRTPTQGNYSWNNTLHELGHALGLKHGQEAGGPGNIALPTEVDSLEFTIMTYRSYVGGPTSFRNGATSFPQTFMMLDIAALQHMYGADFVTNATNTTYTWSPTTGQSFVNGELATDPAGNRIFMTIWDGGGDDTYDLSNYTTDLDIDLEPGGWSTFSAPQLAFLGDGNNARGNVANALLFQDDLRSLIENATGGSGNDTIFGNQTANVLRGGLGNDTLDGRTGADTMYGGTGNDIFIVDNVGDGVVELADEGTDEVRTTLSSYVLPTHVENLVYTGTGAATLFGNAGANQLTADAGAQVFRLESGGVDNASGGAGNDGFYFGAAYTAEDVVNGGAGDEDQLALQGNYAAATQLGSTTGVEMIVLLPGDDNRFGGATGTNLNYNIVTADSNVAVGQVLAFQANTLRAGESFTLNGSAETNGSFLTFGGAGTDNLTGGQRADGFFFGAGRFNAGDVVDGGGDVDQIGFQGEFTGGNRLLFGEGQLTNVEFIVLLSGTDTRFGAGGPGTNFNYNLRMADGNVAGGQRMTIQANTLTLAETLTFDGGNESNGSYEIFAGAGNDVIFGSQNADEIWGGGGNDGIRGLGGADILRGDAGADRFIYANASDSLNNARDQILDFATGDLIDLSVLRINSGGGSFTFIGSDTQNGARQIQVEQTGNAATVRIFLDADSVADLVIDVTVIDGHALIADDFSGLAAAQEPPAAEALLVAPEPTPIDPFAPVDTYDPYLELGSALQRDFVLA